MGADMEKPLVELKLRGEWYFPSPQSNRMTGTVVSDPRRPDRSGCGVVTSKALSYSTDPQGTVIVETKNTRYVLVDLLPEERVELPKHFEGD